MIILLLPQFLFLKSYSQFIQALFMKDPIPMAMNRSFLLIFNRLNLPRIFIPRLLYLKSRIFNNFFTKFIFSVFYPALFASELYKEISQLPSIF